MPTYEETLEFLYSRLPVFQHIGAAAYKANLDNTIALCDALENPQNNFKCIHVGGTNGKGSVSSMLAAIFTKQGYKTGLYTSPHLVDFRERIRVNGQMIPKDFVVEFTESMKPLIDKISPSFFELTVGMSFDYFKKSEVDIAIIEVGMGGRLDSTNIITPELSVITNIGWDHMEFLGDTLPKIAAEKAGIIKNNIPVVVGEVLPETLPVFEKYASENSAVMTLGVTPPARWIEKCALKGEYQKKNLGTVKAAITALELQGYHFSEHLVLEALQEVKSLTGLKGRWEVLQVEPQIIADTAHNPDGLKHTMAQLEKILKGKLHIVLGVVKEKDLTKIISLLPSSAEYYFCKPNIFRGLDAHILANEAKNHGLKGNIFDSVQFALKAAKNNAEKHDTVYIGGSTFVVAEVL
ncbi:MAG: bifunctional folylpolyglutamate synthase/dihydrofolate synthase [Sphingomonadales bacterium]|nr:bifunctional folylpolyglutamate synthase/dihydrofolate synthase [Sphingomonadales bacterium]